VTAAPAREREASGEVRVWTVQVGGPVADPGAASILSPDERARAARFRVERDRDRFVACRLALRRILGRVLRMRPERLDFGYGPNGKPSLAGTSGVEFNVSHREDLAVIAVTRGRRVGVDVEKLRSVEDSETLSARFFSADEAAALRTISPEARDQAFLACWTRKEAFVKARGDGLSLPLDSFAVSLAPGEPAAILSCAGEDRSAWSMFSWSPAPDYLAALVVEGSDWRLRRARWDGTHRT